MKIENLDDFKHSLQSGRMNFLIGSGLSFPYFGTLGYIEKYLEELDRLPEGDAKKIIKASVIKEYFERCISKNYELVSNTYEVQGQEVLKNYQELLNNINKITLLRKSSLLSKQVNLFTTNVDIFLEKSLEEQKIEFNDGFMGRLNPFFELSNFKKSLYKTSPHYDNKSEVPVFNLFKLHGSVTWALELQNDSNKNEVIRLENKLSNLLKVRTSLERLPLDCLLSITVKVDDKEVYKLLETLIEEASKIKLDKQKRQYLEELEKSYNQIYMINPTKEKFKFTTLNYTYYELLRMFSNELECENTILFVMGFSFADEHIREIVLRAINSNPTLIVCIFAFNDAAEIDIKRSLGYENVDPKYNNLKFISRNDDPTYTLENINIHFKGLAEKLCKNDNKQISLDSEDKDGK
jgi:hypothetical protein